MTEPDTNTRRQRPTEPIPASFRPAWLFMLSLAVLVIAIATAAYIVDRAYYG